jgi:hypothetical protein
VNEKLRRLKKSTMFNLFVAGLWSILARMAFHLLPLLPALLVSVASFVLLMAVFFPRKQELEQGFKEELTESKRTWKKWNR